MMSGAPAPARKPACLHPSRREPPRSPRRLKRVFALAAPYFKSEEKWRARTMFAAIVALNLGTVYMPVLNNQWYGALLRRAENKDQAVFWREIGFFCWIAFGAITIGSPQVLPDPTAAAALARLDDARLPDALDRQPHLLPARTRALCRHDGQTPDNPDQRIQEDMQMFTDYTMTLSMGLLNAVVTLVSFIGILWGLSGGFDFRLAAAPTRSAGSMVWLALAYCVVGTRHHALHRPAADRHQLPAAALRGRLPPSPGAGARVQRGDRAGPRRAGRARASSTRASARAAQLPAR